MGQAAGRSGLRRHRLRTAIAGSIAASISRSISRSTIVIALFERASQGWLYRHSAFRLQVPGSLPRARLLFPQRRASEGRRGQGRARADPGGFLDRLQQRPPGPRPQSRRGPAGRRPAVRRQGESSGCEAAVRIGQEARFVGQPLARGGARRAAVRSQTATSRKRRATGCSASRCRTTRASRRSPIGRSSIGDASRCGSSRLERRADVPRPT